MAAAVDKPLLQHGPTFGIGVQGAAIGMPAGKLASLDLCAEPAC